MAFKDDCPLVNALCEDFQREFGEIRLLWFSEGGRQGARAESCKDLGLTPFGEPEVMRQPILWRPEDIKKKVK